MIYIFVANEDWVCNNLVNEWKYYNPDKYSDDINKCDKVWIVNDYILKNLPNVDGKTVITTIHHIDDDKYNEEHFKKVNKITTYFHTICQDTYDKLRKRTDKDIVLAPFPIDKNKYFEVVKNNRKRHGFNNNDFIIGSFQRDTEGEGIKDGIYLPKLSKGPDIFLEIIKKYFLEKENLIVLLTGYRRNYLIENLEKLGIRYKYVEKASIKQMNEFYNLLDLYIVSSRTEGGPRSIFECAITKTNIMSTDVGIARDILSEKSIYQDIDDFYNCVPVPDVAYKNVLKYLANTYMIKFNQLLFNHLRIKK